MNILENKIDEILKSLHESPWKKHSSDYHKTYLTECLRHVNLNGLWMEFGVYRGRSLSFIASQTKNLVYGFDSFEGLHERWDANNPKWVYSLNGKIPDGAIDGSNDENPGMFDSSPTKKIKPWASNIRLVKGYFEDSMPKFLEEHTDNVAFMNIDSDLYSSAKTVLTQLIDRIVPGTIICFDEICDYPDYRNHEIKAFAEFLLDTGFNYKCLAYQPSTYSQGCFMIKE
jgi:hypothetical protein